MEKSIAHGNTFLMKLKFDKEKCFEECCKIDSIVAIEIFPKITDKPMKYGLIGYYAAYKLAKYYDIFHCQHFLDGFAQNYTVHQQILDIFSEEELCRFFSRCIAKKNRQVFNFLIDHYEINPFLPYLIAPKMDYYFCEQIIKKGIPAHNVFFMILNVLINCKEADKKEMIELIEQLPLGNREFYDGVLGQYL